MIPSRRPQMTRAELIARINKEYPAFVIPAFFVVGIRGYYKKTMGNPDQNDRRIYDDAMFLISRDEFYSFNANCDPGAFRKGIANLKAGIWPCYTFDLHKGKYLAICQRLGPVTVIRDGGKEESGMFGINLHEGGVNSVSSEGCQTTPKPQYNEWIKKAKRMSIEENGVDFKKHKITYVLLEN